MVRHTRCFTWTWKWHHRETGDIYPPGPDATGGRYWVVPDPPPGIPYVLRYKTDAYAVEFEREYCPGMIQEIFEAQSMHRVCVGSASRRMGLMGSSHSMQRP